MFIQSAVMPDLEAAVTLTNAKQIPSLVQSDDINPSESDASSEQRYLSIIS